MTVTDEDGLNSQTLYLDSSSGSWFIEAGGIYTDNGDGSFTGPDGNLWYSYIKVFFMGRMEICGIHK